MVENIDRFHASRAWQESATPPLSSASAVVFCSDMFHLGMFVSSGFYFKCAALSSLMRRSLMRPAGGREPKKICPGRSPILSARVGRTRALLHRRAFRPQMRVFGSPHVCAGARDVSFRRGSPSLSGAVEQPPVVVGSCAQQTQPDFFVWSPS